MSPAKMGRRELVLKSRRAPIREEVEDAVLDAFPSVCSARDDCEGLWLAITPLAPISSMIFGRLRSL